MDDLELRVFKKKRSLFVENVEINCTFLDSIKSHEIFNSEECTAIMNERTQNSKVMKFFDMITSCSKSGLFEQLCMALTRSFPWLAKDLQSDLKTERGNLVIDPDVVKEAAMLVHRKFGTSRRLSELEKKEIQDMIALKIQISKEEWRTELKELRDELEHQQNLEKHRKAKEIEIAKTLSKYIKDNKDKLSNNAHDMETTTQLLNAPTEDGDNLPVIRREVQYILKKFSATLVEKSILSEDRERCLKALKLPLDTSSLYDTLNQEFKDQEEKVKKLNNELIEKEKQLKQTTKSKWDLEDSSREINDKMTQLKSELSEKTVKLSTIQEEVRKKQLELDELKKAIKDKGIQTTPTENGTAKKLTRPSSKTKLTLK
ncbi:DgyrCDS13454 [Dimorphilus gyrociliatus]|uniref:DgyrCDS13454 n=1 Tax=Dimorphilus gyrociliatus TaxID=2664684 RepID=A0A7I8WAP6_9ANNE|nr:DgyrCDS13454 [Dimorphilus gyrociliatus]